MPRPPRPPAAPSAAALRPAALDAAARTYLTRYFTTRARLRVLLLRRVDRALAAHGGERAPLVVAVDAILDRLAAEGALNDAVYARDKTRSLVRRGVSEAGIRQRLVARGVGGRAGEALDAVRAEGVDPAMSGACAYVRRRRLGPYRTPELRASRRQQDLSALGRAGFPYAIAREVLDLDGPEQVEARIFDG